jgi:hypothetical protein
VNNIKIDCGEMRQGGMNFTDLILDRDEWRALVNTVMNHYIPIKCLETLE